MPKPICYTFALLLTAVAVLGCGSGGDSAQHDNQQTNPQGNQPTDWAAFATAWKAASPEERAKLVDIGQINVEFKGKSVTEVKAVFGEPTEVTEKEDFLGKGLYYKLLYKTAPFEMFGNQMDELEFFIGPDETVKSTGLKGPPVKS